METPISIKNKKYLVSPKGILFNIQTQRPTKKWNHKVGTFHCGLKTQDEVLSKAMTVLMKRIQENYQLELAEKKKLEKPLCDLPFSYENGIYTFNPFRLNSCGWDGKKNKVFVNTPKLISAENKELEPSNHYFGNKDEYSGRVFFSIIPYWNQEGIGIVLRLRAIQFETYAPMPLAS